jgi:CheY-like chemotaxis protein
MSQSKPKFTEIDFGSATPDRRTALPITNLPVNALSDDTDPTREIRSLIEQLQQTARDARAQLKAAEDERNDFAAQLDLARRQNDELRAHFVEITTLIRERDAAVQDAERQARTAIEAQARFASVERACQDLRRQSDEAARQRDEAIRQRDELNRRTEAVSHASRETNRCFNEAQRQMLAIRQARDTAISQNQELTQKLARGDDEIAELQYRVEDLEQKAAQVAKAGPALETLRGERDEARQKLEAVTAELEHLRSQVGDLGEQSAAAVEASRARAAELAEIREQAAAIGAERDALRAESERYAQEIEQLRKRPDETAHLSAIEALRLEICALEHESTTGELRVQVLSREVIDLRNQLQDRAEQLAHVQHTADDASGKMAQTRAQFEMLTQERDLAQRMREEALTSLAAAQKQVDKIIRDRDLARQQSAENTIGLEAQVEALRAQLAALESAVSFDGTGMDADISELARLLEAREYEKRELADRLEQQRVESIDLAEQLRAAQEQIKMLGASVGELRLQAKQGGGRPFSPASAQPVEAPPPLPEPFATAETHDVVRSMRRCYQSFLKNPADVSHLNELHCEAHNFAEKARVAGLTALYRLSSAFSSLAQELYHYPEQISSLTLRTVGQTIEFVTTLLKVKDLRNAKDPAKATVYVVDDDVDNCDCIAMAMETAMMRTTSCQDPAKALCQLADTPCDLIFLDVNLPGMDGFELCAEIRQLALHARTPIIFLSGMTSSERRVQSSLSGGNEFVGKPFILWELTLKALTLTLKSELHLA